jgi:hypothetical protein
MQPPQFRFQVNSYSAMESPDCNATSNVASRAGANRIKATHLCAPFTKDCDTGAILSVFDDSFPVVSTRNCFDLFEAAHENAMLSPTTLVTAMNC